MRGVMRALLSGITGAMVCATSGFLVSMILMRLDNTSFEEIILYGLIVAFLCAFIGLIIGFIVGIGNLGVISGGIVGFAFTLLVVALYVISSADPGEYGYFLRESRIFIVVLSVPTILTGVITALLKGVIFKSGAMPQKS